MDDNQARFLRAFNPYLRVMDGKEPSTPETEKYLQYFHVKIEHDKVQAFIDRENQFAPTLK